MNIYDIAKEAGVSIATVSRVLNGSENVRDLTRQKVEKVLKKYNYVPSAIARGLMTNSMKTIGIVTIDIRNLYYANVAHTIEQALRIIGFNSILCNTGYDIEQKIGYLRMLTEKKVDSVILVGSTFRDPLLDKPVLEISKQIPVIIVNAYYGYPNTYSIQCDDRKALEKFVEYLAHRGRRNFLYLYDADTFSGNLKLEGFQKAASKHGNIAGIHLIRSGIDEAANKTKELLRSGILFDAVLTSEDLTAIGVLQGLRENGIAVPEQVSVVGYNNSILSLCCHPLLSTVDSRMEDMGKLAVKVLHQVLSGERAENSIKIAPQLIFRQTT
ncbi:MAG: LacI family transcriptional regulator [Clostridiaceae bacterium]|jgi:DNA-binding LacI/PurR family transcriptional regulator|nr:LacI family transcriptional regulator [Clostridiaceae bacterium]